MPTEKENGRKGPVGLRLDRQAQELLDRVLERVPISRHALLRYAVILGLRTIYQNPGLLQEIEEEEVKRKWAGLLKREGEPKPEGS